MKITDLKPSDISTKVIYTPKHKTGLKERGVITWFNKNYIFVRFDGEYHGKACLPETISNKASDIEKFEMEMNDDSKS